MVTVHRPEAAVIRRLAQVLRDGGLVAVPTETVYGLAANGLHPAACRRIFAAKNRPPNDPLILHLHRTAQVHDIAHFSRAGERLAERFWPGPLTLVLDKRAAVPDVVTAGLPTVAVRVPAHPVVRRLLAVCALPLAAPSANPFGYVSPTTAAHVVAGLGERIEHVLDGGACAVGVESTILDLRDLGQPRLLRPGGVPVEDLEAALGRPIASAHQPTRQPTPQSTTDPTPQSAPGQLTRHYSPRTPLRLHPQLTPAFLAGLPSDVAALFLVRPPLEPAPPNWRWLSEHGDLREAANRLFAVIRELDAGPWTAIDAELAPENGLGRALNDRLRRAAQHADAVARAHSAE